MVAAPVTAIVPESGAVTSCVRVWLSTSTVTVSLPPAPFMLTTLAPACTSNVSSPVPPVRFSTPLKLPMSVTSPALGVEMSQVLVPSAWVIVSLPVPPVMSPVSVPPLAMLKVSSPVPPVRFSKPLKVPMSVTSPALGVEIYQVLEPSAWNIVS